MPAEQIPNFGLYGEPGDSVDSLGIHIEKIAERSRGQNWVIQPHRHGTLFQTLCILNGRASVHLDGNTHDIGNQSLVTIPVGIVHGFSFSPDTDGFVITISQDAINQLQASDYLRPVFEQSAIVDMRDEHDLRNQLESYIALMRQEFGTANQARLACLMLLANLLMVNIKRQFDSKLLENAPGTSHLRTLDAFLRLVEKHFREHWQVQAYATALNVSTSTLNRMCQERFGSSAKSVIAARVISEAKRRLVYTQQSLDQIAYHLGFKDPAYFSRVFKKFEHMSPGEYRKENKL